MGAHGQTALKLHERHPEGKDAGHGGAGPRSWGKGKVRETKETCLTPPVGPWEVGGGRGGHSTSTVLTEQWRRTPSITHPPP